MPIVYLSLISFVAWMISTLAGGGSPLILVPLVNLLLGAEAVAPVITTGMLLGNTHRILFFWRYLNWPVTLWYLPGAVVGAVLGAYAFTQVHVEWLHLLIAVFLLLTVLSYSLGKRDRTFPVQTWHFLPVGFVNAFISGLIGSSGPIMNPFYLNYGLVKEEMVATKAANVVVIHIVKLVTYAALGALTPEYLGYGLVIGLAAVPGNWVGQCILNKMSETQFRQMVLATMTISSVLMLWQQRNLVTLW